MYMRLSIRTLVNGAVWTVGAYGLGSAFRLVSNIILARLLAPELFGLMLIVNTLATGISLFTDIGIFQNIIYSKDGDDPRYYNTAWSLQIIRGVVLFLVFLIAAVPVARFYNTPILESIVPISAIGFLIGGFTSVSPNILQKRMDYPKLNLYTLSISGLSTATLILLTYVNRTIWALVFGGLVSTALNTVGTHFLVPDVKHRFYLNKQYVFEIVNFGKWIFLSSIVYFASGNFDRLYLAKAVPLGLLGIYGIARSISDLQGVVVVHLGNNVIFPFIASHGNIPRESLRQQLMSIRFKFLFLIALGCSLFIATADLAINLLYDQRYHAATWMLPILLIGGWFSMIVAMNESTLLGLGRPSYSAATNSVRFILLAIGLPLSLRFAGLIGGIVTLTLIEAFRYIPVFIGQRRERFSFGMQDLSITLAMFMMIGLWEWLRWASGFGTSFDSLGMVLMDRGR